MKAKEIASSIAGGAIGLAEGSFVSPVIGFCKAVSLFDDDLTYESGGCLAVTLGTYLVFVPPFMAVYAPFRGAYLGATGGFKEGAVAAKELFNFHSLYDETPPKLKTKHKDKEKKSVKKNCEAKFFKEKKKTATAEDRENSVEHKPKKSHR